MISFIFVCLAAICNSVMDNINHHYYKSIFKKFQHRFWNPAVSWDCAKKIFGWKFDAWHCFKSSMIILIAFAIVFYTPFIHPAIDFILLGLIWNGTFNLFYNHLLNTKK